MTKAQTHKVVEAYEAWDPDEESSTDLAERLGISKARLYQILDREGITPKARRPAVRSFRSDGVAASISSRAEFETSRSDFEDRGEPLRAIAEEAMEILLDEITALRAELSEYRRRYGPMT